MTVHSDRIDEVVASMTPEEKYQTIRGTVLLDEGRATGYVAPIERLDIPALTMVDGPLGVRLDEATAFPASIALGATFDPELGRAFGAAIGAETRSKGIDVLLAPGCNLIRVPHCGRNFEYYSEDPYHSGELVAAVIEGIQSQGVVATVKHYVANNQERDRTTVSAAVSERALRELYCRPFEAAVDADVGAVMAAYNRINGTDATEHEQLLTGVLKEEFGFAGPVMSDWYAVTDGTASARAGTDLEMPGAGLYEMLPTMDERLTALAWLDSRWPDSVPGPKTLVETIANRTLTGGGIPDFSDSHFQADVPEAIDSGTLSEQRLDDMVRRVLTLHAHTNEETQFEQTGDHRSLARRIAVQGTVLLHNDGVLPLDESADVAMIGPNVTSAKVGGGGSSEVTPTSTVNPVEGVRARSSGTVSVAHGQPSIEEPSLFSLDIGLSPFDDTPSADLSAAIDAASDADVAVVVVQDIATEAKDRESLALPDDQNRLIQTVADTAEKTVVVVQSSGPVALPWTDAVDATLCSWYPGQEAGDALAAVLFGDSDPGGRLPVSFATEGTYLSRSETRYPGVSEGSSSPVAEYDEGVFVGYRWFDDREIDVEYPFGHGLSYAAYEYRDLTIDGGAVPETATVTVANTADRPGREVIQLYVEPQEPTVDRPSRQLAGFVATSLSPTSEQTVSVDLDERAFAYYDEEDGWTVDTGPYTVHAGRSVGDGRLSEHATVQDDAV